MSTCRKVRREFIVAFDLTMDNDLTTSNIPAELRLLPEIAPDEEEKRKKPRRLFSDQKLNVLFASEWYDPDSLAFSERMKWDLSARYWIPLIGLFHGFRIRESVQLCVCDINSSAEHPLLTIQVQRHGSRASLRSAST